MLRSISGLSNSRYSLSNWMHAWYRDPNVWPKKRTLEMFDDWFDLEFHSMIINLYKKPIFKE